MVEEQSVVEELLSLESCFHFFPLGFSSMIAFQFLSSARTLSKEPVLLMTVEIL